MTPGKLTGRLSETKTRDEDEAAPFQAIFLEHRGNSKRGPVALNGLRALFIMANELTKTGNQVKGKSKDGYGTYGLGLCARSTECDVCIAARETGEWVLIVVRNHYLNGSEAWMISELISDCAQISTLDIEKHAHLKGWHKKAEAAAANAELEKVRRPRMAWQIALSRYKQFHNKSFDSKTADRMVELMAKMSGAVESAKTSVETNTTVAYEDRLLLHMRTKTTIPQDNQNAITDRSDED